MLCPMPTPARRLLPHALIGIALLASAIAPAAHAQRNPRQDLRQQAANLTSEQVDAAIDRAIRFLTENITPAGQLRGDPHQGGLQALCTLAILQAQRPQDQPLLQRLVANVARKAESPARTYVVSLQTAVLALHSPAAHKDRIQALANWLAAAQLPDGIWSYSAGNTGRGDLSNAQFALLGLHEARLAGASVPTAVWLRAHSYLLAAQCDDGGWHYYGPQPRAYGSMTAAGVSSLYIAGARLNQSRLSTYDLDTGAVGNCGQYVDDRPLRAGLAWLADNFRADENPGRNSYQYYWLYSVERVAMLLGLARLDDRDWYREAATWLLARQMPNGSWGSVENTAFALLFLGKGRTPLLIQKLQTSGDPAEWNVHRNDLRHLCDFLGARLNGQRVAWQTIPINAPLQDLLASPILHIQGQRFPSLTPEQKQKLVSYVHAGGTLLVEAACSQRLFDDQFRLFCAEVFPDSPLMPLQPDHPIYIHPNPLTTRWPAEAAEVGCRTAILYLPKDVTNLWERREGHPLCLPAFQLGENIAHFFASAEALPDRLASARLAIDSARTPPLPPRGALQIGQLVYDGPWNPHPQAMPMLALHLHQHAGVDVLPQPKPVELRPDQLQDVSILYWTGHLPFALSDGQRSALAQYLRRGGFLFAAPCCGHDAFNVSIREELARLLPEATLQPLPPDHPIITGNPGFDCRTVAYKSAAQAEQPNQTPVLEAIILDGRVVAVFTPYDLGGGIVGHAFAACRGYQQQSARNLAANIVLHALTN